MDIKENQKQKLNDYVKLLLNWNQKINLIGKSTEADIWERHILDCSQLIDFLDEKDKNCAVCADFGTGAGLPGIILSILGIKNMTLIEKSPLKCKFLQEAIKLSDNKIKIINKNIFDIKDLKFDIVFSRALANLNDLIKMIKPFLKKDSVCYFLKGKKINEELEEARKNFDFQYELIKSKTSNEGRVIMIKNIK